MLGMQTIQKNLISKLQPFFLDLIFLAFLPIESINHPMHKLYKDRCKKIHKPHPWGGDLA
jgi:hypothetical protein